MSKHVLGLLAALLLVSVCAGCQKAEADQEKRPVPVNVQPVELQTPDRGARYTASIVPASQVEVSFRVPGYLTGLHSVPGVDGQWRPLQAGDLVSRGTELARLRPDEYRVKVEQAQAQVSEVRSALATAEAQLREAKAALARSEQEFTRARNLFETASITKRDYEAAETQREVSQARVAAIESQIQAVQAKSGGAQALVREAELAQDDTLLVAPLSGTVIKRLVEVGSFVAPGRPAFILADTSSLRAVFGIPDIDLPMLRLGTDVSLTADALPGRKFHGRVVSLSPAADTRTRVFDVEVAVRNQANLLRIGMICSLELASSRASERLLPVIPINSVIRSKRSAGGYAVYVVEDTTGRKVCRLREITLGDTYGNRVIVTAGLKAGENVVTSGATVVQDGDRVQVVAW
ncbi:MAG: efflux RND transporter periplasmic adaptor subunit [Acidobacteria bacterium]|nr:MAG: efflux RND transporter periplasmic adaptor subunit [Acidobacteriota bacterium]